MGLKIKWNDDRIRGATTAVLLIARDRLHRGDTEDLIEASLAEFRDDPERYKANKAAWAGVKGPGPLTAIKQVEYYNHLISATNQLVEKWTRAKRQFNSLLELDNALIAALKDVR